DARPIGSAGPARKQGREAPPRRRSRKRRSPSTHVVGGLERVALSRQPAQRVEAPIQRPAERRVTVEMEYVRAEVDRREVGGRCGTGRKAPPEAGEIGTSLAVENGDDAAEDHTT